MMFLNRIRNLKPDEDTDFIDNEYDLSNNTDLFESPEIVPSITEQNCVLNTQTNNQEKTENSSKNEPIYDAVEELRYTLKHISEWYHEKKTNVIHNIKWNDLKETLHESFELFRLDIDSDKGNTYFIDNGLNVSL